VPESIPPIEPLLEVSAALGAARVEHALGGSGMLHALGLAERVGDWDLTTDAPLDMIRSILGRTDCELVGPSGIHADSKLRLHGGAVELILGMAFATAGGICRIPTLPSGQWRSVPLASPEAWAVAYALMGRGEKSDRLFDHLAAHGCDPGAVQRLAGEPLPEELRARLVGLPSRGPA
jgi:hypothetical protein